MHQRSPSSVGSADSAGDASQQHPAHREASAMGAKHHHIPSAKPLHSHASWTCPRSSRRAKSSVNEGFEVFLARLRIRAMAWIQRLLERSARQSPEVLAKRALLLSVVALCAGNLLAWWVGSHLGMFGWGTETEVNLTNIPHLENLAWKPLLEAQLASYRDFQSLLEAQQHPPDCSATRILRKGRANKKGLYDGFCGEFRTVARLLQVAFATGRTLVLTDEFRSAYEPDECKWGAGEDERKAEKAGWECIYEPLSRCAADGTISHANIEPPDPNWTVPVIGPDLLDDSESSDYFDLRFYGPQQVVDAPQWPWDKRKNIDVVPHWERMYGRFWVRSQMAHFLWRPHGGLGKAMRWRIPDKIRALITRRDQRWIHENIPAGALPDDLGPEEASAWPSPRFIGFHVRLSDNMGSLAKSYGRNGTHTRSLEHYVSIADKIRDANPSYAEGLQTIFLATDNKNVVAESEDSKWRARGWVFVVQNLVERTDVTNKYLWFSDGRSKAATGIASDLEVLRRADFLVGSFQSNVFRLAAELNAVWTCGRYPAHMKRVYSVDIEYYEDP